MQLFYIDLFFSSVLNIGARRSLRRNHLFLGIYAQLTPRWFTFQSIGGHHRPIPHTRIKCLLFSWMRSQLLFRWKTLPPLLSLSSKFIDSSSFSYLRSVDVIICAHQVVHFDSLRWYWIYECLCSRRASAGCVAYRYDSFCWTIDCTLWIFSEFPNIYGAFYMIIKHTER